MNRGDPQAGQPGPHAAETVEVTPGDSPAEPEERRPEMARKKAKKKAMKPASKKRC